MPTPSPERVRAVLEELYGLDPSLREYGDELTDAVNTLLSAKPDAKISPQFVTSLRSRLAHASSDSSIHSTLMEKLTKFLIPTAAVATVAVVIAVVVSQPGLLRPSGPAANPSADNLSTLFASNVTVTREESRAFGDLGTAMTAMGGDAAMGSSISYRSQSGGGGTAPGMPVPAPMIGETTSLAVANPPMDAKMIAPDSNIAPEYVYERVRYVYDGELPELTPSVDVYRRIKKPIDASSLTGGLNSASLGLLDLSRFSNSKLQQFTLIQPGPYGYQIYVDLNEGAININQDWMSWPRELQARQVCAPGAPCGDNGQISAADVPDDATLTGITDAFLSDHGISKEPFGTPVVDRRWSIIQPYMKGTEALTTDMKMRWAPPTVTVIYPIQIEGGQAHDQSGYPYGLTVSVDLREKKVASVWNLTSQQYQASAYDAVTDAKQILDIASRGDVYSAPFGQDPNERIRDVKLGAPTRVLMQSWHQTKDGLGEEILVPALRFPVIADAEGFTGYREAVVVPLAKELATPVYTIMGAGGDAASGVMLKAGAATPPPATTAPPAPAVEPVR